jgi:hypothetical protein
MAVRHHYRQSCDSASWTVERSQVGKSEVGHLVEMDDPTMSAAAVRVYLHNTFPQAIISEFRQSLL